MDTLKNSLILIKSWEARWELDTMDILVISLR